MGKAKGSKKSSKQTRKENQLPYSGSRRSSMNGSASHNSQDQDHSTVNGDNSANAQQRIFGRDLSTSLVMCKEMGVSPLPPEDEVDDSVGDESTSGSKHNPTNQHVTPAVEKQDQIVHVPQAPRVLATSQKQNCNSNASIFFDVLTPPRRQDTQIGCLHYPAGPNHFERLCDEVILHIFRYLIRYSLSKCACVCKRWNRLVNDEIFWRRVDASSKVIESMHLALMVNRGSVFLRLAKTEIVGDRLCGLKRRLDETRFSRLQYLDLSMAVISTDLLAELLGICRNLRKLSLESVELNEKIFHLLGENKELECLNLCMCQGITTSGLMPIFANCRNLESLNLGWTWMARQTIIYLALCMPSNIRKLNISGCRENITDEDVLKLTQSCPNLVELDLSDATAITGASVMCIEQNLQYLEHLALSRCYHVSPNIISVLGSLSHLLAIDVFGMLSERPLLHLRAELPRVQINQFPFSSVARPTTGNRRTSIWGERVRENIV